MPPDLLAGFKGPLRGGEGRGRWEREGEGKGRGEGGEGKGRLTLMCSWNRATDWLRLALLVI